MKLAEMAKCLNSYRGPGFMALRMAALSGHQLENVDETRPFTYYPASFRRDGMHRV